MHTMYEPCHYSRELQRVKLGDALEIRNGIMLEFYPGLEESWH